MPQMSPMPWMFLFFLSMFSLFAMSSYIYFFNQKENFNSIKLKSNNFYFKW